MKRIPFFALLLATTAAAQAAETPIYTVMNKRLCGIVRRSTTQVQTWCWSNLDSSTGRLIWNSIAELPAEGGKTLVTFPYAGDIITWGLALAGSTMTYEVVVNTQPRGSGALPQ